MQENLLLKTGRWGAKPSGYWLEVFHIINNLLWMGVGFSQLPFPSYYVFLFSLLIQPHLPRSFLLQCSIVVGQTPKHMLSLSPPFWLSESLWTFSRMIHPPQQRSPRDQEKEFKETEREQEILPPDPPRGFRHLLFLGPTGLLFPLQTVGPLRPQWVGNFMENL